MLWSAVSPPARASARLAAALLELELEPGRVVQRGLPLRRDPLGLDAHDDERGLLLLDRGGEVGVLGGEARALGLGGLVDLVLLGPGAHRLVQLGLQVLEVALEVLLLLRGLAERGLELLQSSPGGLDVVLALLQLALDALALGELGLEPGVELRLLALEVAPLDLARRELCLRRGDLGGALGLGVLEALLELGDAGLEALLDVLEPQDLDGALGEAVLELGLEGLAGGAGGVAGALGLGSGLLVGGELRAHGLELAPEAGGGLTLAPQVRARCAGAWPRARRCAPRSPPRGCRRPRAGRGAPRSRATASRRFFSRSWALCSFSSRSLRASARPLFSTATSFSRASMRALRAVSSARASARAASSWEDRCSAPVAPARQAASSASSF